MKIIADVLGVVRDGAKKTQVMYQANLSYRLLTRYLKDVMDLGLVRMEDGNTYELTKKGCDFLRNFRDYHERRVKVEEELNRVEDEKVILKNRFLNAKSMDAALQNHVSRKDEETR